MCTLLSGIRLVSSRLVVPLDVDCSTAHCCSECPRLAQRSNAQRHVTLVICLVRIMRIDSLLKKQNTKKNL